MKHLICFFDSSVELVPRELASHPQVIKNAAKRDKKPLETMLERSKHHKAILRLEDNGKRGRPDILHTCLEIVSDSPPYKKGILEVMVHTIGGKWILIKDRVRFPVTYNNFIGLMERLLLTRRVVDPSGRALMEVSSKEEALKILEPFPHKVLLTHVGRMVKLGEYVKGISDNGKPACFLIGAYPKGRPSSEIWNMAEERISIYGDVLAAWTVTAWLTYEIFKLKTTL